MALTLTSTTGGNYKPHPEGIHLAVCVDVIDLGIVDTEYGPKPKVRLVFETKEKTDEGKHCTIGKQFTASLNPKATLCKFLGSWRGKPIVPNETIDIDGLVGKCCTIVVAQETNDAGKTYANINAVSKPTGKLAPSGDYDPAAARVRMAEWAAKNPSKAAPAKAAAPKAADDDGDLAPEVTEDEVAF
jgi:hypothetical protein